MKLHYTHEAMMKKTQFYRAIWQTQTGDSPSVGLPIVYPSIVYHSTSFFYIFSETGLQYACLYVYFTDMCMKILFTGQQW